MPKKFNMSKKSDRNKFHNSFLNSFYENTSKSIFNDFKKQNPNLTPAEYAKARRKIESDLRAGKSEIRLKF